MNPITRQSLLPAQSSSFVLHPSKIFTLSRIAHAQNILDDENLGLEEFHISQELTIEVTAGVVRQSRSVVCTINLSRYREALTGRAPDNDIDACLPQKFACSAGRNFVRSRFRIFGRLGRLDLRVSTAYSSKSIAAKQSKPAFVMPSVKPPQPQNRPMKFARREIDEDFRAISPLFQPRESIWFSVPARGTI